MVADLDELATTRPEGVTLLLGSPTLTGALVARGMVDELRLLINPIAIGSGGRPLAQFLHDRARFELAATRHFTNGSVLTIYRPTSRQPRP